MEFRIYNRVKKVFVKLSVKVSRYEKELKKQ
jgi:hypothetical protein